MYHGKYESHPAPRNRKPRSVHGKPVALAVSLILVLALAVGGTLAWLSSATDPVANTFGVATVKNHVEETFDGTVKKNVYVQNDSDISVYIRVRLVTYRVNGDDNHPIGGTASIPEFDLGDGWVHYGDCYYYTKPVPVDGKTSDLIGDAGITLQAYTDVDGGRQVIEVMSEAIQADPVNQPEATVKAVGEAWGVTISENSVTQYGGGNA